MNERYISAVAIFCSIWALLMMFAAGCVSQDGTSITAPSEMASSTAASPSPTGVFPLSTVPGLVEPDGEFPCAGGNWYGIKPGITTEQDLLSWLETSPFVDRDSVVVESYRDSNNIEVHGFWLPLDGYERLNISVISGTVVSLLSRPRFAPDLGTVVSSLGDPEYVSAEFEWQCDDNCSYALTVGYPALGITFYAYIYNQCDIISTDPETGLDSGPLTPDILVRMVECYQPGSLLESLERLGWTPQQASIEANRAQKWPGWGRILLLEPEN